MSRHSSNSDSPGKKGRNESEGVRKKRKKRIRAKKGHAEPPAAYRFPKGRSGNPSGRSKASPKPPSSPLDFLIYATLLVGDDGGTRELSVDEILERQTFQDAIKGNYAAQKEMLKKVERRQKWRLERYRKVAPPPFKLRFELTNPKNADEALMLLGIAVRDEVSMAAFETDTSRVHLLLNAWAVNKAVSRPGGTPLTGKEMLEVERQTNSVDELRWRKGGQR